MTQQEEGRRTKQEALLIAIFPFLALSLLNHFYGKWLVNLHPGMFWLADLAQFLVAPWIGWWFGLRPLKLAQQDYGLVLPGNRHLPKDSIGFLLFCALLLVGACWPIFVIADAALWQYSPERAIGRAMPTGFALNVLVALYLSATAALVEEVVCRALPWLYFSTAVAPRWRKLGYVSATSVAVALMHSEQGPAGMIASRWFGLVAASMYAKLRTLWPLVLGHFLIDFLIFGPW